MSKFTLGEINIYPVKSFAGFSLDRVQLDRFGPTGDRRWMLVDESGVAITQRDQPRLALIKTGLRPSGLGLQLEGDQIELSIPDAQADKCRVKVWGDKVTALDSGDEAAAWLAERLYVDCRLVYMPDDGIRPVDGNYASAGETVGFADAFPLLLISRASLDDLNHRMEIPVPMNRFRPNLVVTGCEAFAEDSWKRIRIGEVEFDVAKPCDRCVMPSIDQATGEKDKNINRVLASFRRRDGKIYFGQNLLYQGLGKLHLSQPLEVLE
ncbi:MAG: MOSC domain-containing protein [Gammaproteobacteria bacterium]|nr:MAG: MOSC domain-containing protein [Gammaproteobacteria bacterium]